MVELTGTSARCQTLQVKLTVIFLFFMFIITLFAGEVGRLAIAAAASRDVDTVYLSLVGLGLRFYMIDFFFRSDLSTTV